jgi:putative endonuclease
MYVGCTNNIEKRLVEHKEGKVYSTKKMLPVELIYVEAFKSKACAYNREKHLKSYGSSLARLKSRIGVKKDRFTRKEGLG